MVEYLLRTKAGKRLYVIGITAGFILYAVMVCVVVATPVWYPVVKYINR